MASGEKKAKRVRDAVMLPKDRIRPASVLHALPGARFYLTQGSSVYLTDRRTEDIERACISGAVTQKQLFTVTCDLALKLKKQVIHLTANDYLSDSYSRPVYQYWVKQCRSIAELTRNTRTMLIEALERGISLPAGQRILHTSPHHDDIMLAYHEITPFLFEHNTNYCAYITSGFTSVTDNYVASLLSRVNLESNDDEKYLLTPTIESDAKGTEILNNFALGYKTGNELRMRNAETLFALKCVRDVWELTTVEELKKQIGSLLSDYFPNKKLGAEDDEKVKLLKGAIRETECDRMWAIQGLPPENVLHRRSKFYRGKFFNPMPTINEDAKPMLEMYEETSPDLITVAFDPEGTGPDTHYKVLQVLAQALRLGKSQKANLSPKVWGYRNVWHRFHVCDTNISIPISAKLMHEMHQTFLCSFGSQKKAEFPSPEYDGPFSVLSQRFHVQILKELRILLGRSFFDTHWHEQIRQADGIILLTEMDVDEFLKHAEDLQSRIELNKQLE